MSQKFTSSYINVSFRDMESAQGILAVMTQAGLEPSADTYTTLLCGFAKEGNMEVIDKLMKECEEKEIFLLDKDLLEIIYSLVINGHKEHVPGLLEKTRKQFGYNQDAINIIFRLINKNEDDSAYLILKSMPRLAKEDGTLHPSGHFFLKQLVKADFPIEKIVRYSNLLMEDNMYDRGLTHATESALQFGNVKMAMKLFDELEKVGAPIRQHYFWPLLKVRFKKSCFKQFINKTQF